MHKWGTKCLCCPNSGDPKNNIDCEGKKMSKMAQIIQPWRCLQKFRPLGATRQNSIVFLKTRNGNSLVFGMKEFYYIQIQTCTNEKPQVYVVHTQRWQGV